MSSNTKGENNGAEDSYRWSPITDPMRRDLARLLTTQLSLTKDKADSIAGIISNAYAFEIDLAKKPALKTKGISFMEDAHKGNHPSAEELVHQSGVRVKLTSVLDSGDMVGKIVEAAEADGISPTTKREVVALGEFIANKLEDQLAKSREYAAATLVELFEKAGNHPPEHVQLSAAERRAKFAGTADETIHQALKTAGNHTEKMLRSLWFRVEDAKHVFGTLDPALHVDQLDDDPPDLPPDLPPGQHHRVEGTVQVDAPVDVLLRRPHDPPSEDVILWAVIRDRTHALSFDSFEKFIEGAMSESDFIREDPERPLFQGVDAFKRLRKITEGFLLSNAGILPEPDLYRKGPRLPRIATNIKARDHLDLFLQQKKTFKQGTEEVQDDLYTELQRPDDLSRMLKQRLGYGTTASDEAMETFKESVAAGYYNANPYLHKVLDQFKLTPNQRTPFTFNLHLPDMERARRPLFMELIWSYWQEQGLLTQTMKSVALRFQNKARGKFERLAHLEIDPLRPVNNLIWGYIQEEGSMLTVTRRNYEYQHQYGLTLSGHAVGGGHAADVREQFLEAFHTLLHLASEFFRQDDDRMVTSDAFPVLNALKEVHLYLSKGAHNQFGDLAWTARTEMLMEQWILSHNALREFIAGRIMVAYPEKWQRQVDGMMSIQGWGDISCIHFNHLAAFGEQILLSIRYIPWVNIHDQTRAKLWAQFWRQEIQGYIHAYRAATGVDLSGNYAMPVVNSAQPDPMIRRRRLKNPALGRY